MLTTSCSDWYLMTPDPLSSLIAMTAFWPVMPISNWPFCPLAGRCCPPPFRAALAELAALNELRLTCPTETTELSSNYGF